MNPNNAAAAISNNRPSNTLFRAIKPYEFPFRALSPQPGAEPIVDLRPSIKSLGMSIRNQGSRDTCSVFAITCLLEFLYKGHLDAIAKDLSEEYLNYSSNLTLNNWVDGGFFWALDDGYQAQGILPEKLVPYQSVQITTLDQSLIDQGRRWPRLTADFIKPWDASKGASKAQLDQTLRYLDRRIPVAFGGWWPDGSIAGTTNILGVDVMNVPSADQKGAGLFDGHSVALVGYGKNQAFPGGGYFIFRNSWGDSYGDKGYGYMPFAYVLNYANDLLAYHQSNFIGKTLSPQAAVASKDRLDIIGADNSGGVKSGVWQSGMVDGYWRAWHPVRSGKTAPGGPVTLVSRQTGQLDAFTTGLNGRVYTAAWNKNQADGLWQGWWQVENLSLKPGCPISAVARKPHLLDIFVAGLNGKVYTAAWDQTQADGKWRGWWLLGDLIVKPGAWVSAVARGPDQINLFTTAANGAIFMTAWDAKVDGGKWRDWEDLNGGIAAPNTPLTAVSRHADQLDVFTIGQDGGVWTAAWNQKENNGNWIGWWKILKDQEMIGSHVAAVSRKPDQLDIFVIDQDNEVWTASWNPKVAQGEWQGWWPVNDGVAAPGSGIAVTSRSPDHLDIFVIGKNGAVWTAAWAQGVANSKWQGWWQLP